ncbi:hypothetical protein [Novosphingobium mangrovi (ex Huang et al. 2023)]|uniref:Uncharacterized protein n=1 Tax=Novosphingobium mangrovi (ex Huang et al. 2023) TaxID=2976432 RepID=A0ABT2I102_9SPHN|nr:hypothetical protein [Novosphingobium mangrovi (ex Huang et al. 2023)]MCT2398277.1 hypothetical protein [Novosphingobium mangrovi (ex Huang et al. 2023)]
MSKYLSQEDLQDIAVVTDTPARTGIDRNFGLPGGLYVATVGLYLGFIGLMAALFLNPELAIPMVLFAGFVVFAFGLAGYWAKMKPDNDSAPMSWGQLAARGIDTLSGRLTAGEAAIQVLTLPVLILGWGLAVAAVVAFT